MCNSGHTVPGEFSCNFVNMDRGSSGDGGQKEGGKLRKAPSSHLRKMAAAVGHPEQKLA